MCDNTYIYFDILKDINIYIYTRESTLDTLFMIYWTVIVMVVVGMKILLSTLTPMTPTISIIINLCNILSAVQKDGILLANWQTILLRGMITIILSLI